MRRGASNPSSIGNSFHKLEYLILNHRSARIIRHTEISVLPEYEWLIAPGPERAIWAVYPPKKVVSPKVKAFIAFLLQRFGQPPYWDQS
jgi:DNA-binding transcriptional LysR family regulator